MDELTANISFDRFADMPEFYGSGAAEYRLAMVKERSDFLDLFAGARHVDAVTYAETPDLMVKMLTEYDIGSLDVLIGNAEDSVPHKASSASCFCGLSSVSKRLY
ncbi:hypothetical protein Halar_0204 (plasmid) [halophilic archaeon DL31]|jgi:hypothetical protein|nr:hypothetical protein Halar_0204 [halophilic archaeon DL31]